MHIIQLTAENVKRLHAVDITPNGHVVEIAGRNEQGKSSVLDSIWYALGGNSAHPPRPIHDGQKSAAIHIDLGELRIKRTWTQKGSYLTVENADGSKPKSPQALLNELVGALSFDPLAFIREKPADQRKTLIGLLGLDAKLAEIDAEAKRLREERKTHSVKLDAFRDELRKMPPIPDDTPDEEIDVAALSAEIEAANTTNTTIENAQQQATLALQQIKNQEDHIENLKSQLEDAEFELAAYKEKHEKIAARVEELGNRIDPEPIRERIRTANATNANVRNKLRCAQIVTEGKAEQATIDRYSAKIRDVNDSRVELLTTAKYPVPGLGFDDNGLTYNGLPFEQASQSVKIRVGVAMGMAMNPKLRVILIRDGSLLDDDALASLYEQMRENDYQLWIERVGQGSETAIVIEDGRIVGADALERVLYESKRVGEVESVPVATVAAAENNTEASAGEAATLDQL